MDTLHKGENDDDDNDDDDDDNNNNNNNQSSRCSVFWYIVELHILDCLNMTLTI